MVLEKVKEYGKRKELSNKAKNELVEILSQLDFNNKAEVNETVAELYKMNAGVLYSYILTLDKVKSDILTEGIDINRADKATHIYLTCAALLRIKNGEKARFILESFIQANIFAPKINKLVFIGLQRAMNCEGADILVSECTGWDEGNISGFRKIWIKAAELAQDAKFNEYASRWFENNNLKKSDAESATLKTISVANVEEKPKEEIIKAKATAHKEISTEELIAELTKRLAAFDSLKKDNKVLASTNESLIQETNDLKFEIVKREDINRKLMIEKDSSDEDVRLKNKQIKELTNKLNESEETINKLKAKLENIESAYNHAGQTGIDELKNNIKSRLSSEYEKYLELKSKEADMDYYDILLSMLDEVYRVLRKNGITF